MLRAVLLWICLATPLFASPAQVDELIDLIGVEDITAIMAQEGQDLADQIETDLLGGSGGAQWEADIARIYDPQLMADAVRAGLHIRLDDQSDMVADMIRFLSAEPGTTALRLEIEARRYMGDEDVLADAMERASQAISQGDPRIAQVDHFINVSRLIDRNVEGAMNWNLYYLLALQQGDDGGARLETDDLLALVWSQEPQVRTETEDWLRAYLMLAYGPLSDPDLDTYTAFYETDAGRMLTDASFFAYDGLFEQIARAVGVAAVRAQKASSL